MKYPYRFMGTCSVTKTCGFVVQVQVKPAMGAGFAGMGVGWTMLTHTIPMCHPSYSSV